MSAAINRAFLLKTRTSPSETVSSGEAYFWLEGQSVKYKDDAQNVYTLATGVSPEEVQDIVGAFITSGNSRITAVYNDAGNVFTITLVEANIVHQNLSGAGTNTHAQIDTHIANTSNPHATTAAQVGADPTGTAAAAVAAHVALSDPHTQYLTQTEGDALYTPIAHVGTGGTSHAAATTSVAGFLSAADKTKLDGVAASATNTPLSSTAPATVSTANSIGVGTTAARADHVHAHGNQTDPALHAVATTSANGFLSSSDKTKLDGVAASATNTPLASTAPANLNTTAAVGVGTTAARADHVHAFPTAANVGADPAGSAAAAQAFSIQRSNHTGTQLSSTISDFTEAAQDAVGGVLTDSSTIDFTYNDAGNTISAVVLPAGVDHNSLSNLATGDAHTQYVLLAGRSGGQTINGSTLSGGNLALSSTANATKGKIFFGSNSVFDEVNTRLAIGGTSPTYKIEVTGTTDAVITARTTSTSSACFLEARNDTSNYIEVGVYGSLNTGTVFGDSTAGKSFILSSATAPMVIGNFGNQKMIFGTNSLERMNIANSGEVTIGGIAGVALTNNFLSINGNVNSYLQTNTQNLSTGISASSDFVATADNGTDTTNFIDMGINNSGYADASFTINGPNDGYLYVTGGDLSIGTATANKIVFFTGDTLAANEKARITPTGQFWLGTTAGNAASKLQIDSTTQGFLMPRVTTTQMEAITTPPAGLQVYNTDLKCVATYDGAKWLFDFSLVVQNNQSSTSSTYAAITELTTGTLPIGRYAFKFIGVCQSTAVGTGVGIRLGAGTATISAVVASWEISQAANGTDKYFQYSQLNATTDITSASTLTANADFPVSGDGVFSLSGAGTVAAQIRTETNGTGVSVRINSMLRVWRVTG